jgi:flagellar assembly factor FliW
MPDFRPPLLVYWNTVIGKDPETSADGMTQHYSDGTQKGSCETKDEKRETALTMVVDNSKTELSMVVTEPKEFCSYHVKITGPLKILGTTTTTTTTTTVTDGPIPPSRSCGQTFYILGKSAVWNGNCFCYKLVMCDTLYQHQPYADCDGSNEKCENAEKDWTPEDAKGFWPPLPSDAYWNTVIGKFAENSDDDMTQSYTDGTPAASCDTQDEKRKTALTMVADNSQKDLSISVLEPKHRCSYKVKVSGPISKLLGLQDK